MTEIKKVGLKYFKNLRFKKNKIYYLLLFTIIFFTNLQGQNSTAKIEQVWQEHNVFGGIEKGMNIHVKFSVNNMLNKQGMVAVYFYFLDGTALKDYNLKYYSTTDGNVAVGENYTPLYTNCSYDNFVLFMPYLELHLSDDVHDLKFRVDIFDNNLRSIARSDYYEFQIDWKQPTYTHSSQRQQEYEQRLQQIHQEREQRLQQISQGIDMEFDVHSSNINNGDNNTGRLQEQEQQRLQELEQRELFKNIIAISVPIVIIVFIVFVIIRRVRKGNNRRWSDGSCGYTTSVYNDVQD